MGLPLACNIWSIRVFDTLICVTYQKVSLSGTTEGKRFNFISKKLSFTPCRSFRHSILIWKVCEPLKPKLAVSGPLFWRWCWDLYFYTMARDSYLAVTVDAKFGIKPSRVFQMYITAYPSRLRYSEKSFRVPVFFPAADDMQPLDNFFSCSFVTLLRV